MSVKEKLQDILGINFFSRDDFEDDYYEEEPSSYYEDENVYDEEEDVMDEYDEAPRSGLFGFGRREKKTEREPRYSQETQEEPSYQREYTRESSYRSNRFGRSNYTYEEPVEERRQAPVKMMLVKAKRFTEVERIAENLCQQRSVIINFDEMDKVDAQRTIDFLSGVTFALKGSVQKVSKCTIVFAVGQVDLVGRIEEMSKEQEGVFSMF